jgi:O-antigen ligase
MAAVSVILVARNYSRLGRVTFPPHIICLFAYVALAGSSVLWAFKPDISFARFLQQAMVLTSIVLPALLAARTVDLTRGVFLCFSLGAIVNIYFVLNHNPLADVAHYGGYFGYFLGKNYLGEFSAIPCLLSLHEIFYPGRRRAFGIIVFAIAIVLLFLANSKTALGIVLLAPLLAGLTLIVRKISRLSPAIILFSLPLFYAVLSSVSGFNLNRVSYIIYRDSTFTGRSIIWDFASYEISRRPLLGWGYQSFWLVGDDAPSVIEAPGFIKQMPNAHNGYYDTTLEMGYTGYILLLIFLLATLHAVGRMADRAPLRAWSALSIVLFIIIYNYLESIWMRGPELLWVVFVIVAVEIARHWQPLAITTAARGSGTPRLGGLDGSRGARLPLHEFR